MSPFSCVCLSSSLTFCVFFSCHSLLFHLPQYPLRNPHYRCPLRVYSDSRRNHFLTPQFCCLIHIFLCQRLLVSDFSSTSSASKNVESCYSFYFYFYIFPFLSIFLLNSIIPPFYILYQSKVILFEFFAHSQNL